MAKKQQTDASTAELSRREREMMDIIYRLGEATVGEVREAMESPPSYSAVRSTLGILESKGHLAHHHLRNRYVYLPTVDRGEARLSALDHLLNTFFDGSAADAVTALLEKSGKRLSDDERRRLQALIRESREDGR